ncbi:MAG: ABATE domain-containing protein [Terriglobales bacterium]
MSQPQTKLHFDLSGGNLALDFANTVSYRPTPGATERLVDYNRLVFFGVESGVYSRVDRLFALAGQSPGRGKSALQKAIQFREALFATFSAVVERRAIPGNALALLNVMLQEANEHGRLVHANRRFEWEWVGMDSYLDSVLWPIARAAADLLMSDELANLRMCASDDCAWLFLDKTKNHRRRWCDMKVCGNRVKARRHYQRVKAE